MLKRKIRNSEKSAKFVGFKYLQYERFLIKYLRKMKGDKYEKNRITKLCKTNRT